MSRVRYVATLLFEYFCEYFSWPCLVIFIKKEHQFHLYRITLNRKNYMNKCIVRTYIHFSRQRYVLTMDAFHPVTRVDTNVVFFSWHSISNKGETTFLSTCATKWKVLAAWNHRWRAASEWSASRKAVSKRKKKNVVLVRKDNRKSVPNRGRFRYPEKAGRNVALLSCAASRIRNLVNSPETVNSGTFDSRSLLYHSPSDQSDPNHGCHEPTLLRTNGPVVARTYKRRSARPNKSHAAAFANRTRHFKPDHQRKNELWDRWKILNRLQRVWFQFDPKNCMQLYIILPRCSSTQSIGVSFFFSPRLKHISREVYIRMGEFFI